MKIGIFGGTFNPIHIGHINIVKNIKKQLNLNVIYFVPTYKTPDKNFSIEYISPKDRYLMVEKAIKAENKSWLRVSDFEYKSKETSYTYKTIKHFKETFKKSELFFIMGEDRYFGFEKWKNYDEIMKDAKIVVYRRGKEINKRIGKEVIYLKNMYFDVSSTDILNKIQWNKIPPATKKYISKKNLYLKTLVFNVLREKRYEHSVAVASHSKRLANKYHCHNKNDAVLAGLIHDLFKLHDDNFLIDYYSRYNYKDDKNIPIPALHGFVCALWLEKEYGMKNKKILNAVKNHTLGNEKATKLEKIVFIADKISSDRKGDKIGALRKLSYLNLDETYKKMIKDLVKKLRKRGIEPHSNTLKAYKYYIDEKEGEPKYEFNLKKNKRKK